MEIGRLNKDDIKETLKILKQDTLRYCSGSYAEKDWIGHFITDKNCFAFGLYNDKSKLIAVLLAEKLSYNGCILWYIAVNLKEQNKGYGSFLLTFFEKYLKKSKINWIFLNATWNSLSFYKKHKYKTSDFSKVHEHVKDL